MGAAVLMLLPQAPIILQVHPSASSGGEDPAALKRCSCSSWHTLRSRGSLKPALSPSYCFLSTSYHLGMIGCSLKSQAWEEREFIRLIRLVVWLASCPILRLLPMMAQEMLL